MAAEVTHADLIEDAISSRLLDLHTSLPGIVKSYQRDKQVADVQIAVQRAAPGPDGDTTLVSLPVVQNVPVAWPGGGGFYLDFPLAKDDSVMLIFSEAAWSQYRESGDISPPGDLRRHSIGYACAVPMNPVTSHARGVSSDESEALLRVPSGHKLRVETEGGTAFAVAIAQKVQARLDALAQVFSSLWTPVPNDGGAALKAALATWASGSNDVASTTLEAE